MGEDKFYTAQKRHAGLYYRGEYTSARLTELTARGLRAHRLSMEASARRKDKGYSNCGDVRRRKLVAMEKFVTHGCTTTGADGLLSRHHRRR